MVSKRFARLIKILSGAAADAEDEIFVLEDRLERFVHFWVLVVRQFVRHRCLVRASALSYSTLIALIPLLAVALSLTSSLLKTQGEEQFQRAVEKGIAYITPPATVGTNVVAVKTDAFSAAATNAAPVQMVVGDTNSVASTTNTVPAEETRVVTVTAQKEIARQIWGFVQQTQGAALGATGVVLLVVVAVSLLGRIEETFNDIWGVTRGRNWLRQIPIYCTTIVFGPVLLIAAIGLAGGSQFQSAKDFVAQMPVIGKLIFQLLPLVVLWLVFTFVYQLVPNTKVKFSAAFVGGAVAGTLWYLNNVFGFLFISRVASNSKIYGSLGLVPVFMIGLYFSWVFLLLGAQIAYAFQNRAAYLQDRLADNVNQRGREFVALRLMTRLGQRFYSGARPATVIQLSRELGIPSRLTHAILRILAHNGLVMEVAGSEAAFTPARPLDTISAHDILFALRTGTGQGLPTDGVPELAEIYGEFALIEQAERQAAAAISLLTLASRMPAMPALPEAKNLPAEKQIAAVVAIDEAALIPPAAIKIEHAPMVQPPEKTSPPPAGLPGSEVAALRKAEIAPARREVVMPDENREFPL
jgi:membrane protein